MGVVTNIEWYMDQFRRPLYTPLLKPSFRGAGPPSLPINTSPSPKMYMCRWDCRLRDLPRDCVVGSCHQRVASDWLLWAAIAAANMATARSRRCGPPPIWRESAAMPSRASRRLRYWRGEAQMAAASQITSGLVRLLAVLCDGADAAARTLSARASVLLLLLPREAAGRLDCFGGGFVRPRLYYRANNRMEGGDNECVCSWSQVYTGWRRLTYADAYNKAVGNVPRLGR